MSRFRGTGWGGGIGMRGLGGNGSGGKATVRGVNRGV